MGTNFLANPIISILPLLTRPLNAESGFLTSSWFFYVLVIDPTRGV